ncbi:MAG: tRNA (adenosine(37)-N6)-threonylcarbamoyltransferase complex transferase subunit TsaD [Helicobacter sp.]|uniref:tRNA (adenosine(37)-N6)-threonylcarbamoyltransferase complex transferase subunit TsaD n=1 Tax=Helicobacter sp. TaxID=218 RepID=UPI0037500CE1|nr:tRNA (adenosine(37)-N6)-threonylcarbamoyltransferase complex transferase subunit TsaD [Helicobacter sp.]
MILSIESSCDDSSLALTRIADHKLLFHTKLSQDSHHSPFGGVVPEIASRLHAQNLPMLLEKIKDFLCATYNTRTPFAPLKAIAIANRPGLSVTLSEGMCMANALALSLEIPLLCLNHLKGHIYSLFIDKPTQIGEGLGVLLVSGGHTQILHIRDYHHITLVAQSLDDSFGESFDKVAKMLSLGYPGGPIVESYAKNYSGTLLPMPIPLLHDKRLAYSFSGLKNAVRLEIAKTQDNLPKEQICASFQEAACTHILHKLRIYFQQYSDSFTHFGVVGGASANTLLRTKIESLCQEFDKTLLLAPLEFCADNAAMIGRLACEAYAHKEFSPLSDTISPKSFPEDFYKDC